MLSLCYHLKEVIYNALVKYLELETPNSTTEITAKYGFTANIGPLLAKVGLFYGALIGLAVAEGIFPPLILLTVPAYFVVGSFFGVSFADSIRKMVSKKAKLVEALTNIKESQINENKLMKERFMRDLQDKKENLRSNTMSLINIKTLELSNKSDDTKEFYIQLKNDYENLLNSIKKEVDL